MVDIVCILVDDCHCLVCYLDLEPQRYWNVDMVKFHIYCILADSLKNNLVFLLV